MTRLSGQSPDAVLALNASEHPAPGAIFVAPLLLAGLWLWGERASGTGLLLAFCGAELALVFNQAISLLWYHPRPFAVPIGRTLVEHVADSSFHSDHLTFLVAIGLGLLAWTKQR
jgi:undecaprenyl-diphosphatase